MKHISAKEAYEAVLEKSGILVDVRESEEVAEMSIPGALCLPLSQLFKAHDSLPKEGRLFFVCASGGRSMVATGYMELRGHKESYNVSGGIRAWKEAGLPTE